MSDPIYTLEGVRFRDVFTTDYLPIRRGRITILRGPSGTGKTTLLRLLNRMTVPDAGVITYAGAPIDAIDPVALRRQAVMLGQSPVLFGATVREDAVAGCRFAEQPLPDDEAVERALEAVRLAKGLDTSPARLSGGERQRLALARVLLMNPEVLLLDEPSAALDAETENAVFELIRSRYEAGRTVIVATHAREVEALGDVDIVVFQNGRVVPKR